MYKFAQLHETEESEDDGCYSGTSSFSYPGSQPRSMFVTLRNSACRIPSLPPRILPWLLQQQQQQQKAEDKVYDVASDNVIYKKDESKENSMEEAESNCSEKDDIIDEKGESKENRLEEVESNCSEEDKKSDAASFTKDPEEPFQHNLVNVQTSEDVSDSPSSFQKKLQGVSVSDDESSYKSSTSSNYLQTRLHKEPMLKEKSDLLFDGELTYPPSASKNKNLCAGRSRVRETMEQYPQHRNGESTHPPSVSKNYVTSEPRGTRPPVRLFSSESSGKEAVHIADHVVSPTEGVAANYRAPLSVLTHESLQTPCPRTRDHSNENRLINPMVQRNHSHHAAVNKQNIEGNHSATPYNGQKEGSVSSKKTPAQTRIKEHNQQNRPTSEVIQKQYSHSIHRPITRDNAAPPYRVQEEVLQRLYKTPARPREHNHENKLTSEIVNRHYSQPAARKQIAERNCVTPYRGQKEPLQSFKNTPAHRVTKDQKHEVGPSSAIAPRHNSQNSNQPIHSILYQQKTPYRQLDKPKLLIGESKPANKQIPLSVISHNTQDIYTNRMIATPKIQLDIKNGHDSNNKLHGNNKENAVAPQTVKILAKQTPIEKEQNAVRVPQKEYVSAAHDGKPTLELKTLVTKERQLLDTDVNDGHGFILSQKPAVKVKEVIEQKLAQNNYNTNDPVAVLHVSPTKPKAKNILTVKNKEYTVLSRLGFGGSSQVYQVLEPNTSHLLAVKCVNLAETDPATAEGYLNEIQLLTKLQSSDRVIKLFDHEYVKQQQILYVVMEKGDIDLSTLLKRIWKSKRTISMPMIIYYWTEMLNAVKDIHYYDIVHSDLKPANFLLVGGRLKLIDFGIASSVQNDMTSIHKNCMVGTYNYMSPEAIQDPGDKTRTKVGYKSDVWSLGCILYNLLYGKTPFQHITNGYAKLQLITNPEHKISFPPVENCPPALAEAVQRCLSYNSKLRPSVAELLSLPYISSGDAERRVLIKIKAVLEPDAWATVAKLFHDIQVD